jgi:MFS superfamily sulfate permease-like transporter
VTAVSVVFLNLLHGVMIGLAVAIALTGWRVIQARVEAVPVGDGWYAVVEGACTFLALPRLTRVLATVPEGARVTIDISVNYLDHAAHQAIGDWQRQHLARGGTVRIDGVVERGRLARRGINDIMKPEVPQPKPLKVNPGGVRLNLVETIPGAAKPG